MKIVLYDSLYDDLLVAERDTFNVCFLVRSNQVQKVRCIVLLATGRKNHSEVVFCVVGCRITNLGRVS